MNQKKTLIIIGSIVAVVVAAFLTVLVINNNQKIETYKIIFDTNGGAAVAGQQIKEGEKVVKPEDPIKEGYQFIEWTYKGKTYDFSSKIIGNITLVAKWQKIDAEKETFVVKFNSVDGTTMPNQILEKGNKIEKPADPTKEGYRFVEWQLNGVKYDFELKVTSDLELVAVYEEVQQASKPSTGINTNNKPNSNNVTKPQTPTLKNHTLELMMSETGCSEKNCIVDLVDGKYMYDLRVNKENYQNNVTGYVIYEKSGSSYKEVASHLMTGSEVGTVYPEPGEKKIYVAKVYATNSKGEKIYSDYSNEIVIDHS